MGIYYVILFNRLILIIYNGDSIHSLIHILRKRMILLSFGGLAVMSLFLAQIWIQHANLRHNIQKEVLEDHKENLLATMSMIRGYIQCP